MSSATGTLVRPAVFRRDKNRVLAKARLAALADC
jgi:hypothetical protein